MVSDIYNETINVTCQGAQWFALVARILGHELSEDGRRKAHEAINAIQLALLARSEEIAKASDKR